MRDIDSTIEEYRQGDFEKRLNLFLQYRALRPDFAQIEKDDTATKGAHAPQSVQTRNRKGKSVCYPFMRLLKWCHSLIV